MGVQRRASRGIEAVEGMINRSSEATRIRAALRRWSHPARASILQVSILSLIAVLSSAVFALAFGRALGALTDGGDAEVFIALSAVALAVRAISLWLSDRSGARAGRIAASAARAEIMEAFGQSGAGFLSGETPGALASRIVDRTAKVSGWASGWIPGVRHAVLGPLVILAVAASQSLPSALILVASLLALPVFIWLTAMETAQVAAAEQTALETLAGAFQSRAANAGTLRAFRAVARERDRLAQFSADLEQRTLTVLRTAFLSGAVLEFFSAVSVALLAVYVGFSLLGIFPFSTGETLTLAEGMTLLVLAPEFFAPIRRLSALHHDRAGASAAAGVLSLWSANAPAPLRRLPCLAHAPMVRFDKVDLMWPSGRVAAAGIDFEARPGEITVIVGPSGSGKTACLTSLLGLCRVVGGRILVGDHDLAPGETFADSIGYLSQTPWSSGRDLASDLRIVGAVKTDVELLKALEDVGASHLISGSVEGLSRSTGRFGQSLSGGERQKIALARILLGGRALILLDEPTAHLDEASEAAFLAVVRRVCAGRTVLVSTHRPSVIAAADRVVRLSPVIRENV